MSWSGSFFSVFQEFFIGTFNESMQEYLKVLMIIRDRVYHNHLGGGGSTAPHWTLDAGDVGGVTSN